MEQLATSFGRHSGVQAQGIHLTQFLYTVTAVSCVQAANSTQGIKHAYTTLTTIMEVLSLFTKTS